MLISVIVLSLGGTFAILYAMKHIMAYFERRRNRLSPLTSSNDNDLMKKEGEGFQDYNTIILRVRA